MKFSEEVWNEAKDFVDTLVNTYGFSEVLTNWDFRTFDDWMSDHYGKKDLPFLMGDGATRVVFIPKTFNFVVKFELDFGDRLSKSFCQLEYEVGQEIEARGLGHCIAKNDMLLYKFNGCYYHFLVMEYAKTKDVVDDCIYDWALKDFVENCGDEYNRFCHDADGNLLTDEQTFESYLNHYDIDYTDSSHCEDYAFYAWGDQDYYAIATVFNDAGIDCMDLHSDNWGFINGNLVMIDYAGYTEDANGFDYE